MRRRLFTALAALSLILCISVCVLWARDDDSFRLPAPVGFRQVYFYSGKINYDRIEAYGLQHWAIITRHISIPCWMLALALALPFVVREASLRIFAKPPLDHCQSCGYDLRATPTRCPECGAMPAETV